ncbi:MAG: hypothetical protein J1E98_03205 [Lachnospiraceae bacterium]|nr:hypothetical protein [Lachnospiraceae bacterium]
MYINNLGMRDEAAQSIAANVNANNITGSKSSGAKTANKTNFPTALESAVESQVAALAEDPKTTLTIEEALARLKNDPEWEDVGTALSALYNNQHRMQVQMSLMSAGITNGLTGLSSYSQYGLGALATSAYGGVSNILGSSIFADQLI